MAQGVLSFQYQKDPSKAGLTAFAGLFIYLDLFAACRLRESVQKHLGFLDGEQGWTAYELLTALALLNLAGGESVNDIDVLERDAGCAMVFRRFRMDGLNREKRRQLKARWRKKQTRALPSPSAVFRFLDEFHDEAQEALRVEGEAFIPAPNRALRGLQRVVDDMVAFAQRNQPQRKATLDMDATLDETTKSTALFCYKGFKAYQPLNVWWAEQQLVVRSEFRDGNVPAGYQQLRVFKDALASLPAGVEEACLRTDTAGYEVELVRYCAEGKDPRFGVIPFAVGVDVTDAFKNAVAEVEQWHPLPHSDGHESKQEWAEVCFVPNWVARRKHGPTYRFIAIREPLEQRSLPGFEEQQKELPFPTTQFMEGTYKLFGMVTNRLELSGEELVRWHRERCGKSEEAHGVMKDDLAGGRLPSGKFGTNAAWWGIMVLALNLHSAFKQLALGGDWVRRRMKAVRFGLLHVAGRVVVHARQLLVRVQASQALDTMLAARKRLLALASAPAG
ncbi:MAG: IS1380 family transposase [Trueperaceae bacterium]|nr:MAG: IS1380 family transposase [Trueperaceae bacterium]